MSDNKNEKFWKEFIQIYKNNPQLWQRYKSKFKDKLSKHEGYAQLLTKLREIDPDATLESTTQKVQKLRAGFRREMNRIKNNEFYVSTWCYFEDFSFMREFYTKEESDSEDEPKNSKRRKKKQQGSNQKGLSKDRTFPIEVPESPERDPFDMTHEHVTIKEEHHSPDSRDGLDELIKLKQNLSHNDLQNTSDLLNPSLNQESPEYNDLLKFLCKQLRSNTTDADICGRVWSTQYRGLSSDQQLFAKKAIDDVLFEASLGNLRENSVQINDSFCFQCAQGENNCST